MSRESGLRQQQRHLLERLRVGQRGLRQPQHSFRAPREVRYERRQIGNLGPVSYNFLLRNLWPNGLKVGIFPNLYEM